MARAYANRLRSVVRDRPGLAAVIASAPVTDTTASMTASTLRMMRDGAGLKEGQAETVLAALLAYVLGASLLEARPPDPLDDDEDQLDEAMREARTIWLPDPALRDERFRAGLEMILAAVPPRNSRRARENISMRPLSAPT